jgi:predicted GTPase
MNIFIKNVIKPLNAEEKILFVINQADKIEPSYEWNQSDKKPSSNQINNLKQRK